MPYNRLCLRLFLVLLLAAPIGARSQVNTDRVLAIGQNALYFEDYMLSIQYFNQAITAKPWLAKPYYLRAIAKLNLEDYRGAEADATIAIDINPYVSDAWEVRGVARQNLGDNRGAISDYDHALDLLPQNRHLLFNKALAQQDIDDYDAADSTFATLLRWYPASDNARLGRARLRLLQGDTVSARRDIDTALTINPNALNGYIMRADIAINSARDFDAALADMDRAVKLQPRMAGLYINRAFLRYNLNDFFGAMADYDYALQLDPLNSTARFNRGLLLAEVQANDRALDDFNAVLNLDPDNLNALYNRAMVLQAKGNYRQAIDDISRVIDKMPDFPGGWYMRASIYHDMGRMADSERDYRKGRALAMAATEGSATVPDEHQPDEMPAELVSRHFDTLLTVRDNADITEEYNNQAIRGRVQDRDVTIEIEPLMMLSYYSSPTELRPNTYYIKDVDDLNTSRTLRFVIVVTNAVPAIDETMAARHFKSIDTYNSYLATHTARPVDWLGRAMDLITIRDYESALLDLDRLVAATPDYALGYMLRAQARYLQYRTAEIGPSTEIDAPARESMRHIALQMVSDDLDRALELAPATAPAWFNKGNIMYELGDLTSALACYTRAIDTKDDMGEAYYNRGYIYLKLGNRAAGIADLSKAGELGILPAYNLIKRISR